MRLELIPPPAVDGDALARPAFDALVGNGDEAGEMDGGWWRRVALDEAVGLETEAACPYVPSPRSSWGADLA